MLYTFSLNNHLLLVIPESFPVFAVGDGANVGGHGYFGIKADVLNWNESG